MGWTFDHGRFQHGVHDLKHRITPAFHDTIHLLTKGLQPLQFVVFHSWSMPV